MGLGRVSCLLRAICYPVLSTCTWSPAALSAGLLLSECCYRIAATIACSAPPSLASLAQLASTVHRLSTVPLRSSFRGASRDGKGSDGCTGKGRKVDLTKLSQWQLGHLSKQMQSLQSMDIYLDFHGKARGTISKGNRTKGQGKGKDSVSGGKAKGKGDSFKNSPKP